MAFDRLICTPFGLIYEFIYVCKLSKSACREIQSCFDNAKWTWHLNCISSNIYKDNIYIKCREFIHRLDQSVESLAVLRGQNFINTYTNCRWKRHVRHSPRDISDFIMCVCPLSTLTYRNYCENRLVYVLCSTILLLP